MTHLVNATFELFTYMNCTTGTGNCLSIIKIPNNYDGVNIGVDIGGQGGRSPPKKNSAGREYLFAPPRMVLDLSAAGVGGVLYLQYLIISKYVHSMTMIKIKNSQLLNRYLCN